MFIASVVKMDSVWLTNYCTKINCYCTHPIFLSMTGIVREAKCYDLFEFLTSRAGGRSNVDDFTLAAEACLPIIISILSEIKRNTYPQHCFLNIDVPTDVRSHKVI